MKKWLIFCSFFCLSVTSYAESPPLRVAIAAFAPPFVMQSTPNHFYGFDIATIEYVCKRLERRCEYIPMDFDKLLPTLVAQKADVAIGAIILTYKRSRIVRFSTPYMVSKAQFFGNDKTNINPPFNLSQLSGKRIGLLEGSVFQQKIRFIDIKKPKIVTFNRESEMIDALRTNSITLALLSRPKVQYWKNRSAKLFKSIGNPFPIGFGFAVAINPEDAKLIREIDLVLLDYQDSDEYKRNYNLYFKSDLE
ncbi:MAG: transporter substrate-binding domain-containing protein [Gammaproteobacteria bacterium]|nr:transporter substrate-binding domain-containing protein [Gammaproteobacteria bacterium]